MSRHDEIGVIPRKRRSALIKCAKRIAGGWLLKNLDACADWRLNDGEDAIVRETIERIAERLIEAGSPKRPNETVR